MPLHDYSRPIRPCHPTVRDESGPQGGRGVSGKQWHVLSRGWSATLEYLRGRRAIFAASAELQPRLLTTSRGSHSSFNRPLHSSTIKATLCLLARVIRGTENTICIQHKKNRQGKAEGGTEFMWEKKTNQRAKRGQSGGFCVLFLFSSPAGTVFCPRPWKQSTCQVSMPESQTAQCKSLFKNGMRQLGLLLNSWDEAGESGVCVCVCVKHFSGKMDENLLQY